MGRSWWPCGLSVTSARSLRSCGKRYLYLLTSSGARLRSQIRHPDPPDRVLGRTGASTEPRSQKCITGDTLARKGLTPFPRRGNVLAHGHVSSNTPAVLEASCGPKQRPPAGRRRALRSAADRHDDGRSERARGSALLLVGRARRATHQMVTTRPIASG